MYIHLLIQKFVFQKVLLIEKKKISRILHQLPTYSSGSFRQLRLYFISEPLSSFLSLSLSLLNVYVTIDIYVIELSILTYQCVISDRYPPRKDSSCHMRRRHRSCDRNYHQKDAIDSFYKRISIYLFFK